MSEIQLQQYDRLINEPSNDWDIYYWATGEGFSFVCHFYCMIFVYVYCCRQRQYYRLQKSGTGLVSVAGTYLNWHKEMRYQFIHL